MNWPFRRPELAPEPTPAPTDPIRDLRERGIRQLERLLVLRFPVIVPLRTIWADLRELSRSEAIWIVPFLAWIGWRTYRRERREVLRARKRTRR